MGKPSLKPNLSQRALARELARLRATMFTAYPFWRNNAESRGEIARDVAKTLRAAMRVPPRDRAIELLWEGSRLRAAVVLAHMPPFYSRRSRRTCGLVLAMPDDLAALRWTRAALRRQRALLRRHAFVQIDGRLTSLLPEFARSGAHVHAAILVGDPRASLRALRQKYGKRGWEAFPDLRMEPIRKLAHAREGAEIVRREFTRNPQFGAFVSHPDNVRRDYLMLRAEVRAAKPTHYVILDRDDRVRGFFGFDMRKRSFFGRKTSGVEFAFDRSIQGLGLAPIAYATMFEEMIRRGIRVYLGGTAQPPVLKLARLMKRELFGYAIEGEAPYFSRRYFRYP